MTDKRIVLTTTGSEEEARKIAHHLVENHLAACVNILPQVTSIYRWQGNVEKAIVELHSYDLPECIAVVIEDGTPEYLKWIGESVSRTSPTV
jgi:periplasmic divalent cation tolerance protein